MRAMRKVSLFLSLVLLVVASAPASAGSGDAPPPGRWPVCAEWRQVGSTDFSHPRDVAVVSPTEAWALRVGGGDLFYRSEVLHWTGRAWQVEPFPTPAGDPLGVELNAFAVVSSDEVWVVGETYDPDMKGARPLSARWDGERWRLVPIGLPHLHVGLNGVAVVPGTSELLAVGSLSYGALYGAKRHTVVLRWLGDRWVKVPSPKIGRRSGFSDVVAVGSAAYMVGAFLPTAEASTEHVLAARLVNGRWTVFRGGPGSLEAVDALSPDLVWAVGPGKDVSPQRGIIMRWSGGTWTTVRRLGGGSALLDITVASPTDTWAVGYRGGPYPGHTLVMRRHGSTWRHSPFPDSTGWITAIDGTPHNLWTFRQYVVIDSARSRSYHRC